LMALAEIGAIRGDGPEDFGVNRPCLSALDRQARRLLIGWARDIGCTISVDPAANLFLRRAGTDPALAPVLTGSPMDSPPQGARWAAGRTHMWRRISNRGRSWRPGTWISAW